MADVKFDYGTLTIRQNEPPHDEQFAIGLGSPDRVSHGIGENSKYLLVSGHMPEKYALLFAASPDLYEACAEALDVLDGMNFTGSLPDQLRAALAKARGES
jgi:hypothetical protein